MKKNFPLGLSESVVREISALKKEPKWMLDYRLKAYDHFLKHELPSWGPDLDALDFQQIKYYAYAGEKKGSWDDVPADVKKTFDDLGVPEMERKYLAGLTTQYESEAIYHKLKERWQALGILFEDTDTGLKKHEKCFKEYFGKLIPYTDNKFAALNSAVWSGGTFMYIPPGVYVGMPIQTYFRINTERMGQFERTLIIVDEGAEAHYIEGCTAPQYMTNSLHSAVVEVYLKKGATFRYTTLQNWSKNIYNLVTKRAVVDENGRMEWVDCNLGSKVTMKYPATVLKGDDSFGKLLSLNLSGSDQVIDAGGKMIHLGQKTKSVIHSKSISRKGGIATYRGIVKMGETAKDSRSSVKCESLLLEDGAKAYSYPTDQVQNKSSIIEHEASVSKLSEDQMNYLRSRGLTEQAAVNMIVSGFSGTLTAELPMEYAVELERLLEVKG